MKHFASGLLLSLLISLPAFSAAGDDPEMAKARAQVVYVYKRLTGLPPSGPDLEAMAAQIKSAPDKEKALREIVAEAAVKNDGFYSNTVLNFAQIEATEERELTDAAAVSMNDLIATIVGYVRDGKDYRTILSGDSMYIPAGSVYSPDNNTAYLTLLTSVKNGVTKLGDPATLTETPQLPATGLSTAAGILTLRGFGSVYYDDGTNRAPFRFTLMNYICRDMEELSDVTRPDVFVRRDVDRAPGGDAGKYRTECVGCHAGMDPYSKSFAYIDFVKGQAADTGRIVLGTAPVLKVNRNNDTFPAGAVVADDAWLNLWYEGTNAALGWDPSRKSGNGLKSWGESVANTKMFPECMAKRVYKTVCLKSGTSATDKASIHALAEQFTTDGYNMQELFKDTAAHCATKIDLQ